MCNVLLGWFVACPCFAKSNEQFFCEIVDDPWPLLDNFRLVLISSPLLFRGFRDFVGFLGAAGAPVRVVPRASVFVMFCNGFKDGQNNIGVKSN